MQSGLKKFTASAKEVEELKLSELLVSDSNVNAWCNDPSNVFGDDDFVCPVSRPATGAASLTFCSNDQLSVKHLEVKMRKLESSQKKLVAQVKSLETIVTEQRSYFDAELAKLRDLFLTKVYRFNFIFYYLVDTVVF